MSSFIGEKLRARAEELRGSARDLLNSPSSAGGMRIRLSELLATATVEELHVKVADLLQEIPPQSEETRHISLIVALTSAEVLTGLADSMDVLFNSGIIKSNVDARRKQSEFASALNLATARGDWDEFNRLTDEYYNRISRDGAAAAGEQGTTGSS